jgi:predicted transcriptional regulator of viral defense system
MGKMIHLEKIKELFDKSPVVDFKSIERIIGVKKNNNYAKLLISNLLKNGKIRKVGKGFYTKFIESSLSVFSFKPAYLGLQSALSFHKVWEQETIPIILTTKKVRRGIRKVMDSNIFIRNIDKRYFFGFDFVREGEFYLPYSNLEKTFVDMVVFNQKMDDEVIKNIKNKIDKKKLNTYLKRYSVKIRNRVRDIGNWKP